MADNDWQKTASSTTRNKDCRENIYCTFTIGCSVLYFAKEYEWWCYVLDFGARKVDLKADYREHFQTREDDRALHQSDNKCCSAKDINYNGARRCNK